MKSILCKFVFGQIRVYHTRCIYLNNLHSFLCFFIYTGEIQKVISVWWCYCNDICVFISEWKFPHISEASIDSFLLMSFAPPQMPTKSLRYSWLISRPAKRMICSSLEPGIIVLITSKVSLSEDKSSVAQPLAWLSPIIKILFFGGLVMQMFLIFKDAAFQTIPGNWEASQLSCWLFGSV